MRTKLSIVVLLAASAAASLSAHVMVSPTTSKAGATQKYQLRVHNEAKVAATSIELAIPDGVTVGEIPKSPNGTFTTTKAGDRVTVITWTVEVPPNRYVALPFTAQNPTGQTELHWSMREHLADGSTVNWSDKQGAEEKGSVTTLTPAASVF